MRLLEAASLDVGHAETCHRAIPKMLEHHQRWLGPPVAGTVSHTCRFRCKKADDQEFGLD